MILRSTLAILLFVPALVALGGPDDHGDTPSTATALTSEEVTNGIFLPGNIEEPGDVDYFSFVVDPIHVDHLYVIETTIPMSDPLSDTFLRLIDKDQLSQLASDDDSGAGVASKILWASIDPGTYYVEVSQSFPDDTGTYSVSVLRAGAAPPDDHGDDPATATLLLVGDPPISGSTELPGDLDFFQFIAVANQFYDIETTGLTTGSDTFISLIDRDGETVIDTDDQGGREFNASRISFIAPPDILSPSDIFYIKVAQFLPSNQGGYMIGVQSPGVPEGLVFDASSAEGFLEAAGDIDPFVLSATQNHTSRINLATTNSINNFELRLMNEDGVSELLIQKNLEFEDMVFVHQETGIYFLLVTEPFQGGGYSISATREIPIVNPDLNLDGNVDAKDFLLMMDAYHKENGQ